MLVPEVVPPKDGDPRMRSVSETPEPLAKTVKVITESEVDTKVEPESTLVMSRDDVNTLVLGLAVAVEAELEVDCEVELEVVVGAGGGSEVEVVTGLGFDVVVVTGLGSVPLVKLDIGRSLVHTCKTTRFGIKNTYTSCQFSKNCPTPFPPTPAHVTVRRWLLLESNRVLENNADTTRGEFSLIPEDVSTVTELSSSVTVASAPSYSLRENQ